MHEIALHEWIDGHADTLTLGAFAMRRDVWLIAGVGESSNA
jgi:hypothetical protein